MQMASNDMNIWEETYEKFTFQYPYIAFESLNSNESETVRHQNCHKTLAKSNESMNTILKLFENAAKKKGNSPFVFLKCAFFGELDTDESTPVSYSKYSYHEVQQYCKQYACVLSNGQFFTKGVFKSKVINLLLLEASHRIESIILFFASFYLDLTVVFIDNTQSAEEIHKILENTHAESIFCSKKILKNLVEVIKSKASKSQREQIEEKIEVKIKDSKEAFDLKEVKPNVSYNSCLKLKNIILFEDESADEFAPYFNANKINSHSFWDMIYTQGKATSENMKVVFKNSAKANSPAIISYRFFDSLKYNAVVITHKALMNKVVGLHQFLKNTLNPNVQERFSFISNFSNLDNLTSFLFSIYNLGTCIMFWNQSDIQKVDVIASTTPHYLNVTSSQFLDIHYKIKGLIEQNFKVKIESLRPTEETFKLVQRCYSEIFGKSFKVLFVENSLSIPPYLMTKFKQLVPFNVIVTQGYLSETIGSTLFSFSSNQVSGSYGLILPCYEAKLVKFDSSKEEEVSLLNPVDLFDKKFGTFTGKLFVRGQAFFEGYFMSYSTFESRTNSQNKLYHCDVDEDNWLNTNLTFLLTRAFSFKFLRNPGDVTSTYRIKDLNTNLVKSLLLNGDLTGLEVKDIMVARDEQNLDVNLVIFMDKNKWSDFFKVISENKVNIKLKKTAMMESNRLLIYDKSENFYQESYNKVLHTLKFWVIDYFSKVLDYHRNFVLNFQDISKIVLISVNNKKASFDNLDLNPIEIENYHLYVEV